MINHGFRENTANPRLCTCGADVDEHEGGDQSRYPYLTPLEREFADPLERALWGHLF